MIISRWNSRQTFDKGLTGYLPTCCSKLGPHRRVDALRMPMMSGEEVKFRRAAANAKSSTDGPDFPSVVSFFWRSFENRHPTQGQGLIAVLAQKRCLLTCILTAARPQRAKRGATGLALRYSVPQARPAPSNPPPARVFPPKMPRVG